MSNIPHILCSFIKHPNIIMWGVQTMTLVLESWIGNQEKYRHWNNFPSVQIYLRQQLVTSTQRAEIAPAIFVNNSQDSSVRQSRSVSHRLTRMSVQKLFVLGSKTSKNCSFYCCKHRFSVHTKLFPHSLSNYKKSAETVTTNCRSNIITKSLFIYMLF